ncbi:hypothetical protein [Hymenobacter antarcticus]|uniref:Uncharacterized protein n=1 Tax=Hymenobacter antarcticus TaxID=486270 RepID=A0ABP7PDS4_9BACT
MSSRKLPILLTALLLRAASSAAQSAAPVTPPSPAYEQVSVPVPRAVSLVVDVARVLFSRETSADKVQALIDRRRTRSERRDQSLTIPVPKNRLTRTLGLVE